MQNGIGARSLTAVLFILAKYLKQPKRLSIGDEMNKLWYSVVPLCYV